MSEEKASGYISGISFRNGESIDIRQNDIVIFVGPNNAGKSQSLKEIYTFCKEKTASIVVSDISITKIPGSVALTLNEIDPGKTNGRYTNYSILGESLNYGEHTEALFKSGKYYGDLRSVFVANLSTTARLTICNAPNSICRDEPKRHPIHYAAFDSNYRKWLTENFKKAFGVDVVPNSQFGASIPLCIGEPVPFSRDYSDMQTCLEDYAEKLESYEKVQNQGDGIKSFTGILLYLMLNYYRTYLIDEPESFLHPPQARIMGQIIGQTLSQEQQAFISTHSEDIIKGLIEVCPDRIKIIRITRNGDANAFSILDHEQFSAVWNDPLLRYSNIMSSLFHKTVILCESDSDCRFYSIVESHLKQKVGKYSETLFIHCGGKHRMAKIILALRALNVDVKLIPDIDVLNDKDVFKGIIEAFGMEWNTIEADYSIIVANMHSTKEQIEVESAKRGIERVFDSAKGKFLSNQEITSIRAEITTVSKWKVLKSAGSAALPAGDATAAFGRLNAACKAKGIFIVTVGELECFIKEVGGHGPEWVNTVLETYPDLDNTVYSGVMNFVAGMEL